MASTLSENGDSADQLLLPTDTTKINGEINGSCEEPMDVDDSPAKPVKKINSIDIICTSPTSDHGSDSESEPIRNANSNSENSITENDIASESSKVPETDETTSSNGFVEHHGNLNHEVSRKVDAGNDESEKVHKISDEEICEEEIKEVHGDKEDKSEKSDCDEDEDDDGGEDDDDDVVLMEEEEADPLASDPQESEDPAAPESDGGNPMDTSDGEPSSENDPLMVDPKDDEVALECEDDGAKSDEVIDISKEKGKDFEKDDGVEDGSVEKADDDKADKTDGEEEKSGESPDKTKSEEDSDKTPEKGKKKKSQQQSINVTPRRSSRNVNKPKVYIDEPDIKGAPAPKKSTEDPDIEEIVPQDPLAMDSPLSDKRGKKTVVVSDPKRLVEIANGGNKQPKLGKKEPTLVIIDTNSILSGKGPVPVTPGHSPGLGSPSQAFSMLPMALPAQGMYPQALRQMKPVLMSQSSLTVTPSPPKPQPPPILPSLTDDMYVVEAPSFIVPYVYEKPPIKPLKGFVEQVEQAIKEIKAQLEKDKEEKKAEEKKAEEKKAEEKRAEEKKAEEKKAEEKKAEEKKSDDAKLEEEKTEENNTDVEMKEKHKVDEEDVSKEKEKDLGDKMEVDSDSSKTDKDGEASTSQKDKESTKDIDKPIEVKSDDDKSDSDKTEKPSDDVKTEDVAKKQSSSYFDNPLGKFFIQIGVNLVQEHVQTDLLRSQKRKKEREGAKCTPEVQQAMSSLIRSLEFSKETNEPFKLELKKCEFCSFKTESALVMAHHLETPHMRNYVYRCNFCSLEVRSPHDILYHMEAEHNVRGRLERAPAFHQCPSCPFEDNQKGKLSRHLLSCGKKYRPERNQEPPLDFEPPAKIPRVSRTRPSMSPGTAVYQAAMSGLKGSTGGHPLLPKLVPTATPQGMMRGRGRPQMINRYLGDMRSPGLSSQQKALAQMRPGMLYRPSGSNSQPQVLLPTSYQLAGTQLYQVTNHSRGLGATLAMPPQNAAAASVVNKAAVGASAAKLLQQPSISITPLPRQNPSSTPASPSTAPSNKPGRPPGFNKATFVICEICDGYIKDLEQLRNHMQWIHKVKIHPKMIYNRPPLNCQKCQFRFFTDQGLERHLLGSHGLVTSSMQEAANKGKDGGRCPVCGRVYQWKLLNHVARDHNMSLKPAHLSYKCTVCTATFGMYKQFENHVYSAHSVVAKRVMDKKPTTGAQPSTSSQGDMLKPLKINDEITIIPQPARTKTKPAAGSNRNPPKKV